MEPSGLEIISDFIWGLAKQIGGTDQRFEFVASSMGLTRFGWVSRCDGRSFIKGSDPNLRIVAVFFAGGSAKRCR